MLPFLLALAVHADEIEATPSDDLAKIVSSLDPGDVLVLQGGTYAVTGLDIELQGTADAPVTIRAADGAEVVLEATEGFRVLRFLGARHVALEGLEVRGSEDYLATGASFDGIVVDASVGIAIEDCAIGPVGGIGLVVEGDSEAVSVARVEVREPGDDGIRIGCGDGGCLPSDVEVAASWVHDGPAYGVNVLPAASDVRVVDTVVHDVQRGIRVHSTEGGAANGVLRNAVFDVTDVGIRIEGAARVENNLVLRTGDDGIASLDPGRGHFRDVRIVHNTVVEAGGVAAYLEDWAGATGMVFTNNLLVNPDGRAFGSRVDALDEGNTVLGNIASGTVDSHIDFDGAWSEGNGTSDLVDAAGGNLYPSDGSAVIDTADTAVSGPEDDFDGRPRDGTPDVGAYEWSEGEGPEWVVQAGFKSTPEEDGDTSDTGEGAGGSEGGCCNGSGNAGLLLVPLGVVARRRRLARSR